jgi:SlyX protein
MNDERIVDLEARLAHQDRSIQELSDELYRQQRHIGELERRLLVLTERVKDLVSRDSGPAPRPEDELPPHY